MHHPGLLQRMQSQWKLSRGLGIANLMVIHRLSDLVTAGDAGSLLCRRRGPDPPRRPRAHRVDWWAISLVTFGTGSSTP
ncbi:hypothetical protein AB0I84_29885 [Streptomyces spectabilis]|uniref:hypothetical protein n=1 Tax=Streptomyces spectabilis TaxID=68270 RepID=UPI0033E265A6